MSGHQPLTFTLEGQKRRFESFERRITDLERERRWNFDDEFEPLGGSGLTRNAAHLLCMSATSASVASGGAYLTFDTIQAKQGFSTVAAAGSGWTHPVTGVYMLAYQHAWETFSAGGAIRLEVDGVLVPEGTIGSGTSGQVGSSTIAYVAAAGSVGKIRVTQDSGSPQTCNAVIHIAITDPDVQSNPAPVDSTYEALVRSDGPIAYWRFNETSGTTAVDVTGNGHDATYSGGVTLGAAGVMHDGSADTAASFDGVDDEVLGLDWGTLEFAGTAPFTVEVWLTHSGKNALQGIITKAYSHGTGNNDGWGMAINNSDISITRASGTATQGASSTVVGGTVAHAVGTYDGTTLTLYINGTAVSASTTAISIPANTEPLYIANGSSPGGGPGDGSKRYQGKLDEIAIYDRALTAAEVSEHYTVGTQG